MNCKIRSWKVSYYQNDQRQWVCGQLTCSPFTVRFHMESANTNSDPQSTHANEHNHHQNQPKDGTVTENATDDLVLQYIDIKQVQRAKSMWVFPAVTVETHDGKVHWFSTLPDRHSVFNALDYFSRHSLLETNNAQKPTITPAVQTQRGLQLLQSVEDSERTLAASAADLHMQGRQLDQASVRLMEMHEDLDTADRLLSGLNTYLGQWSLPPQYKETEMVQVSKGDVSTDLDLEVLSSELSKDHWRPQQLSVLRVTDSGLTLLSTHQRPLHSLRWMDLSRVFVVSPWEAVLTKHVAGRADVSVSVVSSDLLPVLRLLERKVSHLMDFQTPPPSEHTERRVVLERASAGTKILSSGHTDRSPRDSGRSGGAGRPRSPRKMLEDTSLHLQTEEARPEQVSVEEVSALRSKLGSLKVMARAVGDELTTQNEALDGMISSVDHADARICNATRRIKKLM